MTQEEKIKDLEERIAIMQESDSALCADLAHYKKVAAGQKGRLAQFGLKQEEMRTKLAELQKVNELQHEKIREQDWEIQKTKQALNNARDEANIYKANYEYFKTLPWYKRIFCKF